MKIISISGLDGSGKSTQAKMLQDFLEKHNKKAYYFHAVQFSVPQATKTFFKKHCLVCKLFKKCRIEPQSSSEKVSTDEKPGVTKAGFLAINLRKIAFIIDVLRFYFLKKKLTRKGYGFLVTDRYFYDTIVNIAYLQKRNTPPRIEKYIPLADAAFYLKIQPESIMTRPRVPEQGLEYLKDKKRLYDMFSTLWNFQIIDGSLPPKELFAQLLSKLKKN
ncbi:MAG: hypothetical protein ACD_14C00070G0004 [uncultured bacterium]|nr:MAG: hypothetical protein ACD_14C00070G0004 [uncultured bacterium]KKQ44104.1 MAG: hypothetical protein US63_C0034G0006 [Candidatus Moranbacteria bacterium GW2011_GWC2_37_8]KKQ60367.1 MAG: hypothetical protein US82_C0037G0007 [Parcubacteria group bacterium GW2011_GWC1_38_22]KKQ79985.1 MAG: hypothetical protein UT03_C0036G0010 [Candidatus Moranbacteria bacterium GW2011_GWD2_38_7]